MTRSNSFALMLVLQAMFFIISIQARHSITFHPNNNRDMIQALCSNAPHNDLLCIRVLSPHSDDNLDLWGLSAFMVNEMEAVANGALDAMQQLERNGMGTKEGFASCREKYNTILVADIPKVREALEKRDSKISEVPLNDALNKAEKCEADFSDMIRIQNKDMRDLAGDTEYLLIYASIF
ncbi:unnamed protein product [Lupinus luteus]|uniref:Pectinesterase inhibitor domain-containing protein n=1 Tax=Lupinus luteus TaxID=3873 RepID=A0AAV1XQC5_LUPLU